VVFTLKTRFAFFFLHFRSITAPHHQNRRGAVIYDDEEEEDSKEGPMLEIRMAVMFDYIN